MNFVAFFQHTKSIRATKTQGISCRLSSVQSDCKNTIRSPTFALSGLFCEPCPQREKSDIRCCKSDGVKKGFCEGLDRKWTLFQSV